jgi:hypothetical protein
MTTAEIISIFLGVLSLIAGIWGLIFGLLEQRKRITIEKKLRSQLWATLERARYLMGNKALLKEFDRQLIHPNKRHLWQIHESAAELYISLVEQYLSQVESFTYDDVKRLCDNGVIESAWQEKQWRILICQRPENRQVDPPAYFVPEQGKNPILKSDDISKEEHHVE